MKRLLKPSGSLSDEWCRHQHLRTVRTGETAPALIFVWNSTMEFLYMRITPYVYCQEDDMWVGWLEAYPDYRAQGASLEELEENLRDIQQELESGAIRCVHHTGELVIS